MHTVLSSVRPITGFRKAPRASRLKKLWLLGLCFAGVSLAGLHTAAAQVAVQPTITFNTSTGMFTYSYSVVNNTSNTLAIISFGTSPAGPTTVQNLTSPMGFGASYDTGNGFVSFFEDTNPGTPQTFAPGSTVSPFVFTSPFAPGPRTFQALDVNGNTFTGTTQAPIPEPSVVSLLAAAIPAVAFFLYRRRKTERAAAIVS
jgi:hypothetical protein